MIRSLKQICETLNKQDCINISQGEEIVFEENLTVFTIDNDLKIEICTIQVDGCLITSKSRKKCDFLFAVEDREIIFLIELKGCRKKIKKVTEQFHGTETFLKEQDNIPEDTRIEKIWVHDTLILTEC